MQCLGRSKLMDMNRKLVLGVVVAIGGRSCGVCGGVSLAQAVPGKPEKQAMTQSKFFCNVKALNANERARHKELTDKLVSQRTRMVETGKGFEFQYSPGAISIAE